MLATETIINLARSLSDTSERLLFITPSVYYNLLLGVKDQRLPCIPRNYDAITFYLVAADISHWWQGAAQQIFLSISPTRSHLWNTATNACALGLCKREAWQTPEAACSRAPGGCTPRWSLSTPLQSLCLEPHQRKSRGQWERDWMQNNGKSGNTFDPRWGQSPSWCYSLGMRMFLLSPQSQSRTLTEITHLLSKPIFLGRVATSFLCYLQSPHGLPPSGEPRPTCPPPCGSVTAQGSSPLLTTLEALLFGEREIGPLRFCNAQCTGHDRILRYIQKNGSCETFVHLHLGDSTVPVKH